MAFYSIKFRVKFKGEDLGLIDADTVTMDQALTLENNTEMTLQEMVQQLGRGSAKGMQAAVWFRLFQLGRQHELRSNFTFGDFDVSPEEEPGEDEPDPTDAADLAAELAELSKVSKKSETTTSAS